MRRKRLTDSDKEFIINNIGKLQKKEICKRVGFSRLGINKFLKREHSQLYQEQVKFKPAPPKEKKDTYSLMVKYAKIKGYDNIQDALRLPHRYEFLKQFRKTINKFETDKKNKTGNEYSDKEV